MRKLYIIAYNNMEYNSDRVFWAGDCMPLSKDVEDVLDTEGISLDEIVVYECVKYNISINGYSFVKDI